MLFQYEKWFPGRNVNFPLENQKHLYVLLRIVEAGVKFHIKSQFVDFFS